MIDRTTGSNSDPPVQVREMEWVDWMDVWRRTTNRRTRRYRTFMRQPELRRAAVVLAAAAEEEDDDVTGIRESASQFYVAMRKGFVAKHI